jgi:hypothetical protein
MQQPVISNNLINNAAQSLGAENLNALIKTALIEFVRHFNVCNADVALKNIPANVPSDQQSSIP